MRITGSVWPLTQRRAVTTLLVLATWTCGVFGVPTRATADETVVACGPQPNEVFSASSAYGLTAQATCPGGNIELTTGNAEGWKKGQNAIWQAVASTGLLIRSASIPSMTSSGVNAGSKGDYGGDFYWTNGSANIVPNETTASFPGIASRDFGFNLVCGLSTCSGTYPWGGIWVSEIVLDVADTTGPTLNSPSGLWQATGWIRGRWNVVLSGDSPSGMCSLSASFAGDALPGSSSQPNQAVWHQCAAAGIADPVDTADYAQGAQTLQIGGEDAAGVPASLSKTVDVDNQPPTVTLSGPTDAPSTAGTQYLTATASAGPSGVAGIACSLDGGPYQWYAASTAQIPVAGVGTHQVQCAAENNAVDSSGVRGTSTPATYSIRIGTPTVAVVAFSKVVDKLRCRRVTERVRIPARWVRVRVHGRVVRVREQAHTQRIRITRCHARTVRRRVTRVVTVHRHGKTIRVKRSEVVRVVVEPRTVLKTSQRVHHGQAATVDGWLGTTTGAALAGQTVDVLTAPDDEREIFHVAAIATTAANGGWSAQLPAGPSRLIEATYPGTANTEGAVSAPAHLIVPAKVQLLKIAPRRVAWGGTIHLTGQLKGGYLPRGGALLRLRIGLGNYETTYGVREHVTGNGRFTTNYTFGAGEPSTYRTFWFQIASLPMGDYPYAPASSRRLTVTVGGHP
jgi:hypothetical protein